MRVSVACLLWGALAASLFGQNRSAGRPVAAAPAAAPAYGGAYRAPAAPMRPAPAPPARPAPAPVQSARPTVVIPRVNRPLNTGISLNGIPGDRGAISINGIVGSQPSIGLNGLPSNYGALYGATPYSDNSIPYGDNGFNRRNRRGNNGFYGGGVGFFPFFGSTLDTSNNYQSQSDPNAAALTSEIESLRGDIDQLKQQNSQLAQQDPVPPEAALAASAQPEPDAPPAPATVIVLRNGRRVETSNFAVMGQTLWNFSSTPVQKIPTDVIDIAASQKANADRGVDFPLSAASSGGTD